MSRPEARRSFAGWIGPVASGLLLALAYPRPDLGLLGFVALVPLLLSLEGCGPAAALRRGWICGGVFFSLLLYWIAGVMVRYGGLPWVAGVAALGLLIVYLSAYLGLFALLCAGARDRFGVAGLLAAPILWTALELARGRLLTGFPWGLLGYTQYRNPYLLQAAAWGGVYAVSFVTASTSAAVAILILGLRGGAPLAGRTGRTALAGAAGFLVLAAGAHLGGARVLRGAGTGTGAPELEVAAVQPNVPQDRKWAEEAAAHILDDLERLTREAAAGGAVLIAWPESASPYAVSLPLPDPRDGSRVAPHGAFVDRLERLADGTGARLVVGTVDYRMTSRGPVAANSARVVTPGEGLGAAYDKIHLVPFGEYVPLARLLFFVERLAGGAIADFRPGERFEPLPTPWGGAAVFICYEAIFPELVRRLAGSDATYLVNLTNDAWFGRTSAPYQHLAMSAVRAAELRRPLLRAANTGISALVDPYGRIVARTPLMETAILSGRITPRSGLTPYARAGDAFAWACAILAALLALATRARPARPEL